MELVIALLFLALFTLVWGTIFTKAGYSGWLALLMLVPVVNLIWLLMFAFSEWPIEKELARLGGRSPPEKPQRRPMAGGLLVEEQNEEQTRDTSVDEMFDQARKLDQRGDWAEAIALFERIAEKLEGQQDGEYARNCAEQIREKMTRGA